ncbi:MAG: amidohydrolase, partial [Planctomycetota bacterium]
LELEALPPGSIVAHGVFLDAAQVRRLAAARCWIVQNPRSNRGNRVGYPSALGESRLVALGTDGYPASMREEQDVLMEEARAHGEDLKVAERRLIAGHALIARRFADASGESSFADAVHLSGSLVEQVMVAGRRVVEDGQLLTGDLDSIRSEAEKQAPSLWARMRNHD